MRAETARTIPITGYLEQTGSRPAESRKGGMELWYHSPIRADDTNPSFKVNTDKNIWFDHGLARGGNIIDLVIEQHQCSVSDALYKLERSGVAPNASWVPSLAPTHNIKSAGEKQKGGSSALELVSQSELNHPALLQYLEKRGIALDVAKTYLREIKFKRPQSVESYFALGWPVETGFEARNARFKGFVGASKDISSITDPQNNTLLIFEGFMDFLSYLTAKRFQTMPYDVIVLNSTNLWRKAVPIMKDKAYDKIQLFLDNDEAGDSVTKELTSANGSPMILDMRIHYPEHEDLNAWLQDHINS